MGSKLLLLLGIVLVCTPALVSAQTDTTAQTKTDSAFIYRKIENYSKKRGFTRFVHGLLFEPVDAKKTPERQRPHVRTFSRYHGKIIRNINVVTMDPFHYAEQDTSRSAQKRLARLGNDLHLKTKQLTIKNLLLIKRNKPFDSLLAKDSERLIRSQRYIRTVQLVPKAIKGTRDSVDVDIHVVDSWSLIPKIQFSGRRTEYELVERNFLGLGHEVDQAYRTDLRDGNGAYSIRYTIPNVMNTYIRTVLEYQQDLLHNYRKGIGIDRPFFSPYTRWAAGFYLGQQFGREERENASGTLSIQPFKSNITDVWAGHAIPIWSGGTETERTTNLVTSARYEQIQFTETPSFEYDTVSFYRSQRHYLFSVGLSARQFVQDRYLFNYGIVEDVPIGLIMGFTVGLHEKNQRDRLYLGGRLSHGHYYEWGFLGANLEYGTYLHQRNQEQSALSINANYFTPRFNLGRWKVRQFVKGEMLLGFNRVASWGDQLRIDGQVGIDGLNGEYFYGQKRWLFSAQTQTYSPWSLLGFRLNPYFDYSLGMLGTEADGFSRSKLYSRVSLGVLLSNDFLVFSHFQLSVSYYPTMPNGSQNLIKTNGFANDSFGLMDFEYGKPEVVGFR